MGNIRETIKKVRRDFRGEVFDKQHIPDNPLKLMEEWLEMAMQSGIREANAFLLSTSSEDNQPDSRVLLLRDIEEGGLSFFTNYLSKKAKDMKSNPKVCLNFYWKELDRQVRIHANINELPAEDSDSYFASRPRESQIGAWASLQSSILRGREELEEKIIEYSKKFEGMDVPRPPHWGGYIAMPFYFEFWQGQESRLHDRISYQLISDDKWHIDRLSP